MNYRSFAIPSINSLHSVQCRGAAALLLQTCRGRFVHRERYLEQHQTEKIDTEVKDIEDMIGYESQKCMHPVHGAAFWGVIRALQCDIN